MAAAWQQLAQHFPAHRVFIKLPFHRCRQQESRHFAGIQLGRLADGKNSFNLGYEVSKPVFAIDP